MTNSNNSPVIAIIGKSFSPLEDYLRDQSIKFITLRDRPKKGKKIKHTDRIVDFSTKKTTLESIHSLSENINGLLNVYEPYALAMSWIGEELNLPSNPLNAAKACSDKYLMRELFSHSPEKISPDFAKATSWSEVKQFADAHVFPLILKPSGLQKSLLVTKNNDLDELKQNFDHAIEAGPAIYAKYSPDKPVEFIIEEFLEGKIYAVDAYADQHGDVAVIDGVVDYETGYEIGMSDNFHYSRILPSSLSRKDQDEIMHVAKLGIQALGMKSSPAHCEVILTPKGGRIVEIGARNGGYRALMYDLANDIDIYGAMVATARGVPVDVKIKKRDHCAVLELFPEQQGIFNEVSSIDDVQKLKSVYNLRVIAKPNDTVGFSSKGFKAACRITLHSSDAKTFYQDLEFIKTNAKVVLKN